MNTSIQRSIISAKTIAPVVDLLLRSKLNFLVWSKQHVEIYDGMIESVSKAGFHVVVLKNVEVIYRKVCEAQRKSLIDEQSLESIEDDLVNEIQSAKSAGKQVAIMFHEVERFSDEALRFVVHSISDKRIAHVNLDKDDLIFATGNMNDKGDPDFPEELKHKNIPFDIVSSRFMNYRYE